MRIGTMMDINTEQGTVRGLVTRLVSPAAVEASTPDGATYHVERGQGHKCKDQDGGEAIALRQQMGVSVGPCQKEEFGADAVHQAENLYATLVSTQPKSFAQRVDTPPEAELQFA